MKRLGGIVAAGLLCQALYAAAPSVMFTDLLSGPNTGGENNNGTILTIYGRNFGATRGSSTVTVGGGAVAAYLVWGGRSAPSTALAQLETISVAIGASAATGTVVVTTSAGASTCVNPQENCQFTVRSGNIRLVQVGGSDSAAGTFAAPWVSITKAAHTLSAGDIAYIKTGVSQTGQDNFAANVLVQNSCTQAAPCALVAYPGATANVGTTPSGDQSRGIYLDFSNWWVIAGLTIRAQNEGIQNNGNNGARIIDNDISCPNGDGQDACLHAEGGASNIVIQGNYHERTGTNCSSDCKEYHTIYMSTNVNHVWIAWNEVTPNPDQTTKGGCRGIQFYSTGGSDQFDAHVHDNYIHDTICDAINFSTMNGNGSGGVEAFNNVIVRGGTGPTPTTSDANYACFNIGTSSGYTTPIQIYNNSTYDCGGRKNGDSGSISICGGGSCSNDPVVLTNNIFQQTSGESYFSPNDVNHPSCSNFAGSSHNIFTGVGTNSYCTAQLANSSASDPLYVSGTTPNLHLQSSSPAKSGGTSTSVGFDFDGILRPQNTTYALGAYEYPTGAVGPLPVISGTVSITGAFSLNKQ